MPAPIPMTYAQIAADLASRINEGEYHEGEILPSYAQIAAMYSVSVSTASRAVGLLRAQGIVEGRQGRGIFVARQSRQDAQGPGQGRGDGWRTSPFRAP